MNKTPNRKKTVLIFVIIVGVLTVPSAAIYGAAMLFNYAHFNSKSAQEDARYNAETQLNSIEGVKSSVVIVHTGGTPPTKKSLDVYLYVDQIPDDIGLKNMITQAFERTWVYYDAFSPDDVKVSILNKERPSDVREKPEILATPVSVPVSVRAELPWAENNYSQGTFWVDSQELRAEFGDSGRERK